MKKALITGITGQDGSYLSELLVSKGYHVVGVVRRTSSVENRNRLDRLEAGVRKEITLQYGDITDERIVKR